MRKFSILFFGALLICLLAQAEDEGVANLDEKQSTLGILSEAVNKNMYGVNKYATAAAILSKDAVIKFGHGSECKTSCPDGCCDDGEGLLLQSAMYTMMTGQANDQISTFINSAMGACHSYNKVSTDKKMDCTKEIGTMTRFMPQTAWYDDNGACKKDSPAECAFMEQFTFGDEYKPSATQKNCGSGKNESCGGVKAYFENIQFNKDGSVSLKVDGKNKKLTAQDFSDPAKLKALGFSEKSISIVSSEFKAMKADLHSGLVYHPNSIPKAVATENALPQIQIATGTETAPLIIENQRQPASPTKGQLVKHLGEDPIGFSEQNIFEMINIRYQSEFKSVDEKE